MWLLDVILDVLSDGEWHGLKEIEEKTGFHPAEVVMAVNFLDQFGFIKLHERKVKLDVMIFDFLKEERGIESSERQVSNLR